MTIKELRMTMMKSKKTDPERAQVLQAILGAAQLIAKEDGNREPTEKDIVAAAKKEVKMVTENETQVAVEVIVNALPEKSMKAMGQVMGQLKKEYGDMLDGAIASKIVKASLA
jgi:uncharacterized protein YqeY